MTEIKRFFNHGEVFRRSFEGRCIRLVVAAYQQAITEKSITVDLDENDITAMLIENISDNPVRLKWSIFANRENPLTDKNQMNKKGYSAKESRIDMQFANITSEKEYRFFMEAKNLKEKDSQLKRRYIYSGIDSFIYGKYPNFFLTGYLLEGDLINTVNGVNKLLKKYKREKEILKRCNYKYHDHYYESEHPDAVVLKHLILDFTEL